MHKYVRRSFSFIMQNILLQDINSRRDIQMDDRKNEEWRYTATSEVSENAMQDN